MPFPVNIHKLIPPLFNISCFLDLQRSSLDLLWGNYVATKLSTFQQPFFLYMVNSIILKLSRKLAIILVIAENNFLTFKIHYLSDLCILLTLLPRMGWYKTAWTLLRLVKLDLRLNMFVHKLPLLPRVLPSLPQRPQQVSITLHKAMRRRAWIST